MRKQALRIFMTVSLFGLLAVTSINGQSVRKMTVNIPFDFAVGGKMLPAGDYSLEPFPLGGAAHWSRVLMRSVDGGTTVIIPSTLPVYASKIAANGKLLFNRYGPRYFLCQIWPSGGTLGRQLLKSHVERELAKSASGRQVVTITPR